jgi:uncharacterized protein YcaQ
MPAGRKHLAEPAGRLTWRQVLSWRVRRNHLARRAPRTDMVEVARRVAGIQAQVASAAELSLAVRVDGLRPSDVRAALWEDRTLARTWAMRGTLHLFAASDLPLVTAALSTRQHWKRPSWQKAFGVAPGQVEELVEAIRDALDGACLTREELAEAVVERVGSWAREKMAGSWGSFLKPAAYEGVLCSGPSQGGRATFVRPDQWLGEWTEHDPDEALREVLRRYLGAFGPATHEDFAGWFGAGRARARRVVESIGQELAEVDVEGLRAWILASDLRDLKRTPDASPGLVRLLPNFDCYVGGSRRREVFIPGGFLPRVSRQSGWISPVVLLDGRVVGVWELDRTKDAATVTVEQFVELSESVRRKVRTDARRLGRFLESPVEVTFAG